MLLASAGDRTGHRPLDCWRDDTRDRQERREQLRDIAQQIEAVPPGTPILAGGDFNAPASDAIFRLLQPRLHDTYKEGGRGWSDTISNEMPVLRIDQVWASKHFEAGTVRAQKTAHSDHRLVVCDLWLRPK